MAEDVLEREKKKHKNPELDLSDVQRYNICLTYIEDMLLSNGRSQKDIAKMPYPKSEYTMEGYNRLIYDELKYEKIKLAKQHDTLYATLTTEQKKIYETVMEACNTDSPGEIVLNVASSGIAALLLESARTAHYRFAIPIYVVVDSMCGINNDSDLAELIRTCKLIIWDEAPMMHRHCFEALDRTLRDILGNEDDVFGGKIVVFGGDFRQILPVVPNGTRQDVVHASLNSSSLWNYCTVLKLTVNMRLQSGTTNKELEDTKRFAQWILDIGNGKIGGKNDGESVVEFETEMLIKDNEDHVGTMINDIYPDLLSNLWSPTFFPERAILALTHEQVDKINERMMSLLSGDERHFYSSDTVCASDIDDTFDESVYTTEFLNTIKMYGIPNHHLTLKIGTPIMCLRNIDQRSGLCNGTRLQVIRMGITNIEARIISGGEVGKVCAIPRMVISPFDKKMPFKLTRRQYPVSVCFALTINKSQGQTLTKVGLYLEQSVFSHGQLYVAVSRVKTKSGLRVLCCDQLGNYTNKTKNVVYKEVLHKL